MKDENIILNITKIEIILAIGVVIVLFGLLTLTDVLDRSLKIDAGAGMPIIIVGAWVIFGYVTKKILPDITGSSLLGFILGIIGVIIAICIKIAKGSKDNKNKYEDLRRLAELKQSGAITEEEFEKEKLKILK